MKKVSSLNPNFNTVEPYFPRHDGPSTRVIAQQLSSICGARLKNIISNHKILIYVIDTTN